MPRKPKNKEPPENPRHLAANAFIDDAAMFTFETWEGEDDTRLTLYNEGEEPIGITLTREQAEDLAHGIYVALEENPL